MRITEVISPKEILMGEYYVITLLDFQHGDGNPSTYLISGNELLLSMLGYPPKGHKCPIYWDLDHFIPYTKAADWNNLTDKSISKITDGTGGILDVVIPHDFYLKIDKIDQNEPE